MRGVVKHVSLLYLTVVVADVWFVKSASPDVRFYRVLAMHHHAGLRQDHAKEVPRRVCGRSLGCLGRPEQGHARPPRHLRAGKSIELTSVMNPPRREFPPGKYTVYDTRYHTPVITI